MEMTNLKRTVAYMDKSKEALIAEVRRKFEEEMRRVQGAQEHNSKEEVAKRYCAGELPLLTREETFCFDCIQCGECCRNRGDILLNPFDVFRLCRKLEMNVNDFFKKYCKLYTGENSKLPLARIDFRPIYGLGGEVEGTRCPFLSNRNGLYFCRVHDAKPFVCFSYPLGRIQNGKEDSRYLFMDDVDCKGARHAKQNGVQHQVEEWIGGKAKADLEDKYNRIFGQFMTEYRNWINIDRLAKYQKGESKEYWVWVQVVGDLLYGRYDSVKTEEEFLARLEENIETIRQFSELLVFKMRDKLNLKPKQHTA